MNDKKQNIDKLFVSILNRNSTNEEVKRYSDSDHQDIIDDLSYCYEKVNILHSKSGERLKTNIVYDEDDIASFFSTNKYKIAICLSGHIRDYESNLKSINKFLVKPLNADVFIHTWDSVGKQIFMTQNVVGPVPNEQNKKLPNFDTYLNNIKKLQIDNNLDYLNNLTDLENKEFYLYGMSLGSNNFGGQAEPKYIYSQLYSVNTSFKLLEQSIENNIEYDFVIKMRADYNVTSGIPIEDFEFIKNNNNTIFVPTLPYSNHGHPTCCLCQNSLDHKEHIEDICDVFAYSNLLNMKKYMNMYNQLEELRIKQNTKNNNLLNSVKFEFSNLENYKNKQKLVNIWSKQNYVLNCFYQERLIKDYLIDFRLLGSKLSGKVLR